MLTVVEIIEHSPFTRANESAASKLWLIYGIACNLTNNSGGKVNNLKHSKVLMEPPSSDTWDGMCHACGCGMLVQLLSRIMDLQQNAVKMSSLLDLPLLA